jgi:hypothetical protein
VDKDLIPKYKPKTFVRDILNINLPEVKCKLRSFKFKHCWNYYINEYAHKEVWDSQLTCKERHNAKRAHYFKNLIPKPKTQVLSWKRPDATEKNWVNINAVNLLRRYFNGLIEPADPKEIEEGPKEFFIDYRGKNSVLGKALIEPKDFTKYDPKIAARMKDKEESVDHPSVIRIFFDTTSKHRFYRKYKKSIKFLTNLKHNPKGTYEVIESLKFHTHAGFTEPNQIAYSYGVSWDQCKQNLQLKRIDSFAKELGYITGFYQDICQAGDLYDFNDIRVGNCDDHEFPDHVFMSPTCSNYDGGVGGKIFRRAKSFAAGTFSGSRSCFMDKPISQMGFDYLAKWLKVYKGKRRYFTLRASQNHNNYGETAHDEDEILANFLEQVLGSSGEKEENLIVRIYADHGNHQNTIYQFQSGDYERHLPIMMNLFPKKWFKHYESKGVKLEENFKWNTRRLSSANDVFWTDLGIIGGTFDANGNTKEYGWLIKQVKEERSALFKKNNGWDSKNWGNDLLGTKLSDNRSCFDLPFYKTYRLDMDWHCHCEIFDSRLPKQYRNGHK